MFLHSWHPHPILVHLGPLAIHWYGLTLALGTVIGFFVLLRVAKRYHLSENTIYDIFFVVLVAGLIGARLYHVFNEWAYYSAHPSDIIKVWNGGLAWHGGLIAGTIALIIMARIKKVNTLLLCDIFAPALAIGQAIGRWGNYFNQELFGRPTNLPWGIPIDVLNRPIDYRAFQYFHPTFLYESLGCLIIFGILMLMHRARWKSNREAGFMAGAAGQIASTYLILAGALRVIVESLRLDHTPLIYGVRLPILVGGLIVIIGITGLIFLTARQRHAT